MIHTHARRTLAIAIAIAVGGSALSAGSAAAAAPAYDRLGGDSIYSIAASASRTGWPTAGSASTVVVASGTDYLSGAIAASAASTLGGPVLFSESSSANTTTIAEVERLAPSRIVIVGAPAASGSKTLAALTATGAQIVRVGSASSNAFVDAEALARLAHPSGVDHVYLAPGTSSPTTIVGAALAGTDGAALIPIRASDASLRASVATLLADLGVERVTILGSTSGVSSGVGSSLTSAGFSVSRVSGSDRYTTSYALADRYTEPAGFLVASGTSYAKALGAVSLAAATGSPLLLSTDYCAQPGLKSRVAGAAQLTLVGGAKTIRGLVGSLEACRDITKASSTWVLANKKNKLSPASYVPSGLRVPSIQRSGSHQLKDAAADALEDMASAARSAGAGRIGIASGYRSYSTQKALYARYVATRGQAWADSQSARAGFSEHQTGLAADLTACSSTSCGSIYSIASTAQGKWLAKNSWKYGFVLRYANGYTSTTGYAYEPWHFRYVGTELAADYHDGGFKTLEGYFGKPKAPKY